MITKCDLQLHIIQKKGMSCYFPSSCEISKLNSNLYVNHQSWMIGDIQGASPNCHPFHEGASCHRYTVLNHYNPPAFICEMLPCEYALSYNPIADCLQMTEISYSSHFHSRVKKKYPMPMSHLSKTFTMAR